MLHQTSSYDLFADAFFIHQDRLMFASLHGRESNILACLSGMTTPYHQGGLHKLGFKLPEEKMVPLFKTAIKFTDLNKRLTKYMTHHFGMLTHMFLYAGNILEPDLDNKIAWVIQDDLALDLDKAVWQNLIHLSDIPLQDHWQAYVLNQLTEQGCIQRFTPEHSYADAAICGLQAAYISFPDDFDQQISQALRKGHLTP